VTISITFVRHGETDANATSIWQGQGDAALSEIGRAQAEALGERLREREFDLVVSSDLVRTVDTAGLAGLDPVLDPGWREMDIGDWEGLTRTEVHERFQDQIRRLVAGDRDVAMGGGETWREFGDRIGRSLDALVAQTPPGSNVLVMAHGGVIHAVLGRGLALGGGRPWPVARVRNTAITEVVAGEDGFQLKSFNDSRHAPISTGTEGDVGHVVALVRHGQSEANVAGRWHGITDGPLTEVGRRQGAELAARYDGVSRVFSSPLQRARLTAAAYAAPTGLEVEIADELIELDFGRWEGLTTDEIEQRFPEEFERVFIGGEDLPRGGSGETFAGGGERLEAVVRRLVVGNGDGPTAMFTHGGAIWALAAKVLGIEWRDWRTLDIPSNVSTTHVRVTDDRPVLMDYNLPLA
jgi:probable phosphoglycerate mutase